MNDMSSETYPEVTVLGHGVLGLLASGPKSGYDISRAFESTLANVWSAKQSQIYPELARLLSLGFVRRRGEVGPRGRQAYAITTRGERELRSWLRDTKPRMQRGSESLLRTFFLWKLEPHEAREYFKKQHAFYFEKAKRLKSIAAECDADDNRATTATRVALEAGIRLNQASADWAAWATECY